MDDRVSRAVTTAAPRGSGSGRHETAMQADEDVHTGDSMRRMTGALPSSDYGGGTAPSSSDLSRLQYSESIRR